MLSLAELGVGAAIVYSLYKPLAEGNQPQIKALMQMYKKAYITIGIVIIIIGSALLPILPYIVQNSEGISNIKLIYLMYVMNSAFSYFFSYKSSLLIADQKRYIYISYHFYITVIFNILQMIMLLATHNYIIYMLLYIMKTVTENVFIANKANKIYPFLNEKSDIRLDINTKKEIIRNIKAMLIHKVGGVIVLSTDNLLISSFVGIIEVGIYSNYLMIINALNMIFGTIIQSITASIGNLGALEGSNKKREVFDKINFIFGLLIGYCSICLLVLFNPFIKVWLGEEYLFSGNIVCIIVINFYITGMRRPVLTFRDALGLYWHDRYKPIIECLINLIISIILTKKLGIVGVFLGTFISTITTSLWIEPYILYKYGFKSDVINYFIKYIKHAVITVIIAVITIYLCDYITIDGIFEFIIKMIICLCVPSILYTLVYYRLQEFKYFLGLIKQSFKKEISLNRYTSIRMLKK